LLPTDSGSAPKPPSELRLHKPFLERAAEGGGEPESSLGLGAFLVLRLVDQFSVGANRPGQAAVEYQCSATKNFVDGLSPQNELTLPLSDIVSVAQIALREDDRRLLFEPVLRLARILEHEARFDESLDVLETASALSDGRDGDHEVATHLLRGRALRNAGRLVESKEAYTAGSAMAERLGDTHSELLGQVGCGIIARQQGNLPDSERLLRSVMLRASRIDDRDAEARACHDLAGTLYFAGRAAEAVPHVFKAYELYEDRLQKARALGDTGTILKELGHYSAAQDAQKLVLAEELPPDTRAKTELECLELAALVGDRITFERFRQSIADNRDVLLRETELDFESHVGSGLSLFGEHDQAEKHLNRAIALAEELGMGERLFHAEQQLREAQERRTQPDFVPGAPSTDESELRHLRETMETLEALSAGERF